jgi:hypothetical protein
MVTNLKKKFLALLPFIQVSQFDGQVDSVLLLLIFFTLIDADS